jgi:hypothetical protein
MLLGLLIHPNGEWVGTCHQKPLPDVKFGVMNEQRSLCKKVGSFIIIKRQISPGDDIAP